MRMLFDGKAILVTAFAGCLSIGQMESRATVIVHEFSGEVTSVVLPQPNEFGLSASDVGGPVSGRFTYDSEQAISPPLAELTISIGGTVFEHGGGGITTLNQTVGDIQNNRVFAEFGTDVDRAVFDFSGIPTLQLPEFGLGATNYEVEFIDLDATVFDAADETFSGRLENLLEYDLAEFEVIRWSYSNSDALQFDPAEVEAAGDDIRILVPEPTASLLGLMAAGILFGRRRRRRRD